MAQTPSKMIPLQTRAPDFCLPDTITGKKISLEDVKSDVATVVMFICNHCPYVVLIRDKLIEVARSYQDKGIHFVAISSNDATQYPADAPEQMQLEAQTHHFCFPYLYDESQEVARAYQAACTPDFFVFDKELLCVYRGRFDEATPGNEKPVTGKDLETVLIQLLLGQPVSTEQKPSVGCNIKWK